MSVVPLTFVASVASITGYNLRNLLKYRRKNLEDAASVTSGIRGLLAKLKEDDDPLLGYWNLQSWTIPEGVTSVKGSLVSGGLAVYLRERQAKVWYGRMCLSYFVRRGFWEKTTRTSDEPPFIAIYDVTFSQTNDTFSGNSTMVEKEYYGRWDRFRARFYSGPSRVYAGVFRNCVVEGTGAGRLFKGLFENAPTTGEAPFVFHQPKDWGSFDSAV